MKRELGIFIPLYFIAYLAIRFTHVETWAVDCRQYVIFPDTVIGEFAYYFWRPLVYVDNVLFGMQFHIGPHSDIKS
jgi:hypothetical protein